MCSFGDTGSLLPASTPCSLGPGWSQVFSLSLLVSFRWSSTPFDSISSAMVSSVLTSGFTSSSSVFPAGFKSSILVSILIPKAAFHDTATPSSCWSAICTRLHFSSTSWTFNKTRLSRSKSLLSSPKSLSEIEKAAHLRQNARSTSMSFPCASLWTSFCKAWSKTLHAHL